MAERELFKHSVQNISNAERDVTSVTVLELDVNDDESVLPLVEVIESLESALAGIPEQFRHEAVLRVKGYGDYVSMSAWVEFDRPETDEELADRKRWLASLKQEDEEHDRRVFERLTRKFTNRQ